MKSNNNCTFVFNGTAVMLPPITSASNIYYSPSSSSTSRTLKTTNFSTSEEDIDSIDKEIMYVVFIVCMYVPLIPRLHYHQF